MSGVRVVVDTIKLEAFSWRLFYYMELWHFRWNFSYQLNSLNDHIRLTVNISKIEMPFLDVLIRISTNNNIITDIFSKDTDIHMYLNFRSSHPKHIKINIPFNLASRIITITNTEELRDTGLRELKIVFEKSTISGGNSWTWYTGTSFTFKNGRTFTVMTVHRQQTRHQDLTIIRAKEHFKILDFIDWRNLWHVIKYINTLSMLQ
jgi:hypothetical protein